MSFNSFLEKCGSFFFAKMKPIFFFTLIALPILAAAFFTFLQQEELKDLQLRFAKAERKEQAAFKRKERKERFLARYRQTDPYFLDQQIESFLFLQKEKERLSSLLHHPAFPESQAFKERLRFIHENRLIFAEENICVSSQMKETEEKQRQAVQMDEQDLQKILSLLENIPVGAHLPSDTSPQIFITDFHLKKQQTPLGTEVLEVEMDLFKREFLK